MVSTRGQGYVRTSSSTSTQDRRSRMMATRRGIGRRISRGLDRARGSVRQRARSARTACPTNLDPPDGRTMTSGIFRRAAPASTSRQTARSRICALSKLRMLCPTSSVSIRRCLWVARRSLRGATRARSGRVSHRIPSRRKPLPACSAAPIVARSSSAPRGLLRSEPGKRSGHRDGGRGRAGAGLPCGPHTVASGSRLPSYLHPDTPCQPRLDPSASRRPDAAPGSTPRRLPD